LFYNFSSGFQEENLLLMPEIFISKNGQNLLFYICIIMVKKKLVLVLFVRYLQSDM